MRNTCYRKRFQMECGDISWETKNKNVLLINQIKISRFIFKNLKQTNIYFLPVLWSDVDTSSCPSRQRTFCQFFDLMLIPILVLRSKELSANCLIRCWYQFFSFEVKNFEDLFHWSFHLLLVLETSRIQKLRYRLDKW